MKRRTDSDWETLDRGARETEVVRVLSRDHFLRAGARWGWRNLNTTLGTLSLSPFDTSQKRRQEDGQRQNSGIGRSKTIDGRCVCR